MLLPVNTLKGVIPYLNFLAGQLESQLWLRSGPLCPSVTIANWLISWGKKISETIILNLERTRWQTSAKTFCQILPQCLLLIVFSIESSVLSVFSKQPRRCTPYDCEMSNWTTKSEILLGLVSRDVVSWKHTENRRIQKMESWTHTFTFIVQRNLLRRTSRLLTNFFLCLWYPSVFCDLYSLSRCSPSLNDSTPYLTLFFWVARIRTADVFFLF